MSRILAGRAFVRLLVVFLLATECRAGEGDVAGALDGYLSERTRLGRFSGAVLVARRGEVIFRRGYGFADLAPGLPYTPETRHEVASLTKMFTAMAALKLRDGGALRLQDPICSYLRPCPEAWRDITVQHLMRHTSGIPDYEEPLGLGSETYEAFMTRPDATERILEAARRAPLDFPPGSRFRYSNTAYIVLAHVVQAAAGRPFPEVVAERVLRPAGMASTDFVGWGKPPERLAVGYTHGDLGWPALLAGVPLTAGHLKARPPLALTPPCGDAGLYSTVDDLYRWSQVMDGGELVPAAEAAEVFTPGLEGYGYGWFVGEGFRRRRFRHTGSLPGYTSDLVKLPAEGITIVAFTNLDRTRLSSVVRDVTAIVLGEPYDMPVRGDVVRLTAAQAARLTGSYLMSDGRLLTVAPEGDLLSAKLEGRFTAGLIPLSPTDFYFPLGDGCVAFTPQANGRDVSVTLRYGGEDHQGRRQAP